MGLDVYLRAMRETQVYTDNITHNLGRMAEAAGIYQYVWCPDELGITTAAELIAPLEAGLATLEADPAHFKQFNPSNGWGDYDGLVGFVRTYLEACRENPDARVTAWR